MNEFDKEVESFEKIFLYMLEKPSLRWRLKAMIDAKDKVDFAELNLQLKKIKLEIIKRKGGEE